MPDGIRWNFHLTPSRTIVWPALLPPWKRMTRSARSASRSMIFPFPSSPHWAPTTTIPGTSDQSTRPPVRRRLVGVRRLPRAVLLGQPAAAPGRLERRRLGELPLALAALVG